MKYTLGNLSIAIAIFGGMAATIRLASPHSVLVLLAIVCGLLGWAAFTSLRRVGAERRILIAAAAAGFGYLIFYVAADTPLEAWINAMAIAPFALMKGSMALPSSVELRNLTATMEFQYFQQKMHLVNALVVACLAAWLASA